MATNDQQRPGPYDTAIADAIALGLDPITQGLDELKVAFDDIARSLRVIAAAEIGSGYAFPVRGRDPQAAMQRLVDDFIDAHDPADPEIPVGAALVPAQDEGADS